MSSGTDAERAVRDFYAIYSDGTPERFDQVVTDDYTDYGHEPPGRGPQGARDDYEHAVAQVGGPIGYDIDALVEDEDAGEIAVAWTGHLPDGRALRGLSLYAMRDGRIAATRHAAIGGMPS